MRPAHLLYAMICVVLTIHQTSPTQDSRLTGGGSPNLVDLVTRKMGAAKGSIHFTHDCTLLLYEQLIQTGSVLLLFSLSLVLVPSMGTRPMGELPHTSSIGLL